MNKLNHSFIVLWEIFNSIFKHLLTSNVKVEPIEMTPDQGFY